MCNFLKYRISSKIHIITSYLIIMNLSNKVWRIYIITVLCYHAYKSAIICFHINLCKKRSIKECSQTVDYSSHWPMLEWFYSVEGLIVLNTCRHIEIYLNILCLKTNREHGRSPANFGNDERCQYIFTLRLLTTEMNKMPDKSKKASMGWNGSEFGLLNILF